MVKKISLSVVTVLSLTSLNAMEFKPVGFKAIGMGGTGVASTRGSLSGYYNPALLQYSDYTTEVSLNADLRVRESNLIDNMDQLNKVDFQNVMQTFANNAKTTSSNTAEDRDRMNQSIDIITKKIGSNNAFVLTASPNIAAQISNKFAIGLYSTVDVGFKMNISSNHDQLIFKDGTTYRKYDIKADSYSASSEQEYKSSSLEYANENNLNYVTVNNFVLGEIPISYARAYDFRNGNWSFGVNAKPMSLTTSYQQLKFGVSSDDADKDSGNFETTYKSTMGIDLGVAYKPKGSKVTLGLMGKNLNSPTFEVNQAGDYSNESYKYTAKDYTLDPMLRAGVSLPILNDNVEFALDLDLTKNDTLIEGEKSQYVGAGVELHPVSWFSLRTGAMQDMASEKFDDGTILTLGLGFGLKWFQFDLSAMMSTKQGEYDGNAIPRYSAVNLSLVSKWGDGYNRKKPSRDGLNQRLEFKETEVKPLDKNRINQDHEKLLEEMNQSLI